MPSCGFVHCFPPGAMAVLSLALCINPTSPPKNVLQIQAYDHHNHYFIQTPSDALGYHSGPESFPLLTCPSLQPASRTTPPKRDYTLALSAPKQ